jgi:hypothetical protein
MFLSSIAAGGDRGARPEIASRLLNWVSKHPFIRPASFRRFEARPVRNADYAGADLYLGPYRHGCAAAFLLSEMLLRISDQGASRREATSRMRAPFRIPSSVRMRGDRHAGNLLS